jgi:hypothetical protein
VDLNAQQGPRVQAIQSLPTTMTDPEHTMRAKTSPTADAPSILLLALGVLQLG